MKKKLLSLLTLALLLLTLTVPAAAASANAFVFDEANLLTAEEAAQLEATARSIASRYHCGVYILTSPTFEGSGTYSIEEYAEQQYLRRNWGLGDSKDGLLLVLSMAYRDYDLCAHGYFANESFNADGKHYLENRFLDNFAENDWFGGFQDYLSTAERLLKRSAAGHPFNSRSLTLPGLLFDLLLGLIPAGIVVGTQKSKMKTVRAADDAGHYRSEGLRLSQRRDVFRNEIVRREYIPPAQKCSGGGGGSFGGGGGGGGVSHSSGKF